MFHFDHPIRCHVPAHRGPFEYSFKLEKNFIKKGISCKVDDGNQSIGKRYARTDEIGIPFGITIDKETLEDRKVTLREIHSTRQIRIPLDDVVDFILSLINGDQSFLEAIEKGLYPEFNIQE